MKIIVLYGGESAEHEISILSAYNVIDTLIQTNYEVCPVYITQGGDWLAGECLTQTPESSTAIQYRQSDDPLADPARPVGNLINPGQLKDLDAIVFPVLHGPNGEDGTIQGFLEVMNVPYVGCGVAASANGMDKVVTKQLFAQADLPQVPYVSFNATEWEQDSDKYIQKISGGLLYPLFVKPANMGSSVGISRVEDEGQLREAVGYALRYDQRIVVEQGITAEECEVAVLGNCEVNASVVGRLVKTTDFYDYDEKYINNTVEMEIPAKLSDEITARMQDLAVRAFRAINGTGLARVDFFLTNNHDIYINEINTMPGFTNYSMYPLLWEATGLNKRDLIEELLQLAMRRYESKQALRVE